MKQAWELFKKLPVKSEYSSPTQHFLKEAKVQSAAMELRSESGILIDNRYCKQGIRGSLSKVYLRHFLVNKINEALKTLQPDYGFVIFDGYRAKKTQAGLFDNYYHQIKNKYPNWTTEQLDAETRKFVAHPDEPSRFEIPPHNSGGAVDLGLTYQGQPVDMGTDFDDLTEKAATDFFERPFDSKLGISEDRWETIRNYRRILFHSLRTVGFTNWKHEWWHYDIGNCVWAQELGVDWIYDSMDLLVPASP